MNINNICLTCMTAEYDSSGVCPVCRSSSKVVNQDHQLAIRSILSGKYMIGRAIGQGGFGITYVAYDLKKGERVAIKEFFPNGCVTRRRDGYTVVPYLGANFTTQFQTERSKFLEEAKKLVALGPIPNIVSVYDFFMENETAYIVMEYIEGETLKQYLDKTKTMNLEDVIATLHPIANALTTIHTRKIMHRDISPDNIMLSPKGAVLLDFGSARPISLTTNLTKTINIKSGYAPLEQYDTHGNQGPWSDVYAFAATIYRAVTGEVPAPSFERSQLNDRLIPPSKLNKQITPEAEAVLLKGLACEIKDRYKTVREFFDSLVACKKTNIYPPQQKKKKLLLPLLILSGVVIAGCIVGFTIWSHSSEEELPETEPDHTETADFTETTFPSNFEDETEEADTTEFAETIDPKSEGVMTHAEFMAAEMATEVVIEAYVQATQSWWNDKIVVYAQDNDGGYFIYNMACSKEDSQKLTPGTKIRVTGNKGSFEDEIEVLDATFEFVSDGRSFIADPFDVTHLLGTDELVDHQNELVAFKDMTVESVEFKNGEPGDDIYLTVSQSGTTLECTIEVYLTDPDTEVYRIASGLVPGTIIDLEGFLFWYAGPTPHITSVTVTYQPEPKAVPVENISLNHDTYTLTEGETFQLQAEVTPDNATDPSTRWSSTAPDVASVDETGTVTAKRPGTAVITALADGKTNACIVTVQKKPIPPSSIRLNASEHELKRGYTMTLTATVLPADVDDPTVTWSSSNESVATVANGEILARNHGKATITAKTVNGKTAVCEITVPGVEAINLPLTSLVLDRNQSYNFDSITVSSFGNADTTITMTSSNKNVVSVSGNTVTAKKPGTATLTFTADSGVTATCTVTVNGPKILASGQCGTNAYWSLNEDGLLTISGSGKMWDYEAPANGTAAPWYADYRENITALDIQNGITEIGNWSFYFCTAIESVIIPSSVTVIGKNAFDHCSSITSIQIPDSVTEIGRCVFYECGSLQSVTLPASVSTVGDYVFFACKSLTSITLPDNLKSIPDGTFSMCKAIASITIPESVTYIGKFAFRQWTSSQTITFEGRSSAPSNWDSEWNKDCKAKIRWDSVQSDSGFDTAQIPSTQNDAQNTWDGVAGDIIDSGKCGTNNAYWQLDSNGTLTISGEGSMFFKKVLNQTENSVTYTGIKPPWQTDYKDFVKTIIIDEGITDTYQFFGLSALTTVYLSNTVQYISSFENCTSLTMINIPNSIYDLPHNAFANCTSLTSISLPNSVTKIWDSAFKGCTALTSVTLSNNITEIPSEAFADCTALKTLVIPDSVTEIGNSAFQGCASLSWFTLPNALTTIGEYAFAGCKALNSLTIPKSVATIEKRAFENWTSNQKILVMGQASAPSGWNAQWNYGCDAKKLWNQ